MACWTLCNSCRPFASVSVSTFDTSCLGSGMVKSIGVTFPSVSSGLREVLGIADGHDRHVLWLQILFGHAQNVGVGHRGDGFLVLENEILGIAVVVVGQHPAESLRARVEVEYEAVFHRLLGRFQAPGRTPRRCVCVSISSLMASKVSVVDIDLVLPPIWNSPGWS